MKSYHSTIVEKAAMAFEPRETSSAAASATDEPVDDLGECPVALGHPAASWLVSRKSTRFQTLLNSG